MSSRLSRVAPDVRLSRNHQTILQAVEAVEPGEHLTAHDVYLRARQLQSKIGFATVHRGLGRLHELGYVQKVDVPGATSAMYEPAMSPHAHFRCTNCGLIQDVAFCIPHEQLAALAAQLGLQIAAESTTFAGRCAACAGKSQTN